MPLIQIRRQRRIAWRVAKEILAVNPYQRIILASAYIMEFLVDTVKQLKQVVELMQKPFEDTAVVDTKTKSSCLEKLNASIKQIKDLNPMHQQSIEGLAGLREFQKGRTFS